jgi:glycyl-tRNA synthetase beta chain
MPEFLLEVFSEEIPARMQAQAAEELHRLVLDGLRDATLTWTRSEAHVTPRRLVLWIDGLPTAQPDVTEERRGPRVDAPPEAIEGFLRSVGLTLDECERRHTGKGEVLFAVSKRPGQPTERVLAAVVNRALTDMPWPKTMRWGEGSFRWIRPIHHILAIFGGKAVPGGFEPEPHTRFVFTAWTRGHRFQSPEPIEIRDFNEYRVLLRHAHVMLDREERKRAIVAGADELAEIRGLEVVAEPGLVSEVAGLVEWPVALIGRIDEPFMEVPPEVLITAMKVHQKYFPLRRRDGSLAPRFVVVANTAARHDGADIVAGNERVLRARLSDAKYFWDNDRKVGLQARLPSLGQIVFHAKLGTMEQKARRMERLAAAIAERVPEADPPKAGEAALLAKIDLVTGMVGEFPELQGVMGRYYALEEGREPAIAEAMAQHYSPLGPSDECPHAPLSVAVALADKLDTLAGFFVIAERPTGSRDPYALRRAALGVIRLITENGVRLGLAGLTELALKLHVDQDLQEVAKGLAAAAGEGSDYARIGLGHFLADRLKVALREKGVRHDLIDAIFSAGEEDDLVRLLARVDALEGFLNTDDGANLLVAYRRAGNIVRIEEKKDARSHGGDPDPERFAEPEERALAEALDGAGAATRDKLGAEDFSGAMAGLSQLRGPVDAFFDTVTVNADDPALRENRLRLLSAITATMNSVADFSKIEG